MRLGRPARDLRLPAGAPSRRSVVADFLRCTAARVHDQVLSGDDPRPFLHELRRYARSLAGSAGRASLGAPRAGALPAARPSLPN
jgi:hypothetical protein